MKNKSILERFEEKIERIPGVDCWIWVGARNTSGYGNFWDGRGFNLAHRFSYRENNGQIPDGMNVLHRCDTPFCVRPSHLFLGTQMENIHDMHRKGRAGGYDRSGERNPFVKITNDVVEEIKVSKEPRKVLCEKYGIGKSQVGRIQRGESRRIK